MSATTGEQNEAGGAPQPAAAEPTTGAGATDPPRDLPEVDGTVDYVFDGDGTGATTFAETAVRERRYDIARQQESTRSQIAGWLIGILAGLLGATYVVVFGVVALVVWKGSPPALPDTVVQLKTLMEPILTALVGLIGSVIGFYFGTKTTETATPVARKPT